MKNIPFLSLDQLNQVSERAARFGVSSLQIEENLGSAGAEIVSSIVSPDVPAVFVVGKGRNGASALVIARFLVNRGHEVRVVSVREEGFHPDMQVNMQIIRRMGVAVFSFSKISEVPRPGIIIDGVLGSGLRGVAQGPEEQAIEWINSQSCLVIAVDIPSGMDVNQGVYSEKVVRADITISQGLPVEGMRKPQSDRFLGDVKVVDCGIPLECYREVGIAVATFKFRKQILTLKDFQ